MENNYGFLGLRPEDVNRDAVVRVGDANNDCSIGIRIRCKGSVVGAVTAVVTTGYLYFKQGAATGSATNTTGTNPQVGATLGRIDCSSSTVNTLFKLIRAISVGDWEAVLVDLPPDESPRVSTSLRFLPKVRALCQGTTYVDLVNDTSLPGAGANEYVYAGLTAIQPSSALHPHDGGFIHRILQLQVKAGFGSTAGTIDIIECDDLLGTTTVKDSIVYAVASQGTTITRGDGANTLYETKGKRLVVRVTAGTSGTTAQIRATTIKIFRESFPFAPGISKSGMASSWQSQ